MAYALVVAEIIGAFISAWERLRDLRLKRQLAAHLGRVQGSQARSHPFVLPGREWVTRLCEFITSPTGRDEDRPGRLLLGRFRESGLSVT